MIRAKTTSNTELWPWRHSRFLDVENPPPYGQDATVGRPLANGLYSGLVGRVPPESEWSQKEVDAWKNGKGECPVYFPNRGRFTLTTKSITLSPHRQGRFYGGGLSGAH